MSNTEEQIQKIVSLKRYETPREGYFEDFLLEFQQRQQSELLHRSSISLFFERASTWFREIGSVKWVAGAGLGYASLMAAILLWPAGSGTRPDSNLTPASFEPTQAPAIPVAPLEKDEQGPKNEPTSQF